MRTRIYTLRSSHDVDEAALHAHDGEQTLALAYCPSDWGRVQSVLQAIRRALPRSCAVALSTAGHFACRRDERSEVIDDEILLQVITLDHGRFCMSSHASLSDDGASLAKRLIAQLPAASIEDLRMLLVYTDGGHTDGDAFTDELQRALPKTVPVSGGMAGDGPRFESTWIWDGERRLQSGSVIVAVSGDVCVSSATGSGWDSFGVDRTVTEAHGMEVHTLDGRSVLELYEEYLGERRSQLPASALLFPLLVSHPTRGETVVRTVLGLDRERGSMRFAGSITPGSRARLMRSNPNRLVDAAEKACMSSIASVRAQGAVGELAVLVVSCVGQRMVLRQRASEAVESIADTFGDAVSVAGFYSYGEFAASGARTCALHNQTFTVAILGEPGAVPSAA